MIRRLRRILALAILPIVLVGCGTTRMTDTQRAASEMLLVSQAVDNAICQIDCSVLSGRNIYFDTQYLDGTVDKGYVISSLRQHLLASGAKLSEDRKSAEIVVEARSGAVGTDRNGLLIGIPQTSIPAVIPGQLTQIPEIAFIKRTDMRGVAKIGLFAFERKSGTALWQSGLVEARSTLRDRWILGAGPFSSGSIKRKTELAGDELSLPDFSKGHEKKIPEAVTAVSAEVSESAPKK